MVNNRFEHAVNSPALIGSTKHRAYSIRNGGNTRQKSTLANGSLMAALGK